MLKDKIVYVVTTGATKAKGVGILLSMLKSEGAQCIVMPTDASYSMLDLDSIRGEWVKFNGNEFGARQDEIPEEDLVVVAPCTFNTLSKIATGIADNYPLSVIHAAIGSGKPVILALAMNYWYFQHPITPVNINRVNAFGRVRVIWPESIYSDDGVLEKVTMAPWEKIVDTICHTYCKTRYSETRKEQETSEIIDDHFPEFHKTGSKMQQDHFTNGSAGFIAKRIKEGVLVTSSGSCVGNLSRSDLTIIQNWSNQVITWSGEAKPSSETPLILEIFDKFPDVKVIIHGHCRSITYSPLMNKYHSSEYLKYGEWKELYKIQPVLQKYNGGIMKLHGELILARDFDEAMERYLDMYRLTC
ncbi:MAG: flavoprotein [bacterium]|nr:flavoprotein [bacterium]